ncbi:MAG: twin-arginine translocase TatA/TatE family subunit [Proteobacteria bacterium]|nr:twin-arginine translocase TatA/TatE family subunit [Pseudomonadota bacterium]
MFGLGVPEIIVIGIIILLIFGAKRLPSIGEGLGKTVKELRNAKKEISGIKKSGAKKEVGESNESEGKNKIAGDETDTSEGQSSEGDIVDTFQKKVTKQVTDKLLGQVPGIKQAKQLKQLKDKADKIKKIVS